MKKRTVKLIIVPLLSVIVTYMSVYVVLRYLCREYLQDAEGFEVKATAFSGRDFWPETYYIFYPVGYLDARCTGVDYVRLFGIGFRKGIAVGVLRRY